MTLEQYKRRYQKATIASSKARVRYHKFLKRLWFVLCTGDIVNALNVCCDIDFYGADYRRVSLESAGDPNAKICVTYRKRGNKVTVVQADAATVEKANALYDAMVKADDEAEIYKLALHDDFKLSYTEINDLYRGI